MVIKINIKESGGTTLKLTNQILNIALTNNIDFTRDRYNILKGWKVDETKLSIKDRYQLDTLLMKLITTDYPFEQIVEEYFNDKYLKNNRLLLKEFKNIFTTGDYSYNGHYRISDGNELDNVLYEFMKSKTYSNRYDTTIEIDNKTYRVGFDYGM